LRQENAIIQAPNDPNFTTFPAQLTKTIREDQFLRCDTGPGKLLNVSNCVDKVFSFVNCCR